MAFFNNIKVGIVDLIDRAKLTITNGPSPMVSLPIDLIVYLFSTVSSPKDIGSLERTCKGFWQIASNFLSFVHTPDRLARRELSLKMGDELEKLAIANIERPLKIEERFTPMSASEYWGQNFYKYDTALEAVSNILPQTIDLANVSDDQAKMYELAGRAILEGITKAKLNLKGEFAILNSNDGKLLIKVSTTKNSFSEIFHKKMMESYARQSQEVLTPKSFTAKVTQLCLFTTEPENVVADSLMQELTKVHGVEFRDKLNKELQAFNAKEASSETSSETSSNDSDSIGMGE